jgi:hypothetical protein
MNNDKYFWEDVTLKLYILSEAVSSYQQKCFTCESILYECDNFLFNVPSFEHMILCVENGVGKKNCVNHIDHGLSRL